MTERMLDFSDEPKEEKKETSEKVSTEGATTWTTRWFPYNKEDSVKINKEIKMEVKDNTGKKHVVFKDDNSINDQIKTILSTNQATVVAYRFIIPGSWTAIGMLGKRADIPGDMIIDVLCNDGMIVKGITSNTPTENAIVAYKDTGLRKAKPHKEKAPIIERLGKDPETMCKLAEEAERICANLKSAIPGDKITQPEVSKIITLKTEVETTQSALKINTASFKKAIAEIDNEMMAAIQRGVTIEDGDHKVEIKEIKKNKTMPWKKICEENMHLESIAKAVEAMKKEIEAKPKIEKQLLMF